MSKPDFYAILRDVPPELQDAALSAQRAKEAIDTYVSRILNTRSVLLRETIPDLGNCVNELLGILHSLEIGCETVCKLVTDREPVELANAQAALEVMAHNNCHLVGHSIQKCHELREKALKMDDLAREVLS